MLYRLGTAKNNFSQIIAHRYFNEWLRLKNRIQFSKM